MCYQIKDKYKGVKETTITFKMFLYLTDFFNKASKNDANRKNFFHDSDHYLTDENVTAVKTAIMLLQLQNDVFSDNAF